ncbi:MAG: hypothetical protein MUC96_05605 [Myxococcaceae bacterium]|jgi:hypothetical protein|nr:hypothetical protein [Myxococcaceae bacterium]
MKPEPLERLGPLVRAANEPAVEAAVRAASLRRAATASPRRRWPLVAAGLLAAAAATALVVWRVTPAAPTAVAHLDGVPLEPNARVTAEAPRTVSFADESVAVLERGAVRLDGPRALVLDDGRLELRAAPRRRDGFLLSAGPWQVRVVNTRVAAAFSSATGRFEVVVIDGEAEVRGPGPTTRRLATGQRFVVEPHVDTAPAPPATPELSAEPSAPASPALPKRPLQPAPVPRPSAASSAPPWLEALKEGAFARAVAEADRAGFARLAASESPDRLLLLADAYRFQQRGDEARTLYLAARSRSRTAEPRAVAAFQLGVSSSDLAEAAEWFEKAYDEAPSGPLAAQALGRLLEVRHRAHAPSAADTARVYLSRWPEGPYAPLARLLTK